MARNQYTPGSKLQKPPRLHIENLDTGNVIQSRLIEVALYDYIAMQGVSVSRENQTVLIALLLVLGFERDRAMELVSILIAPYFKGPSPFENILLYNQLQGQSKWTRDRFKIPTADPMNPTLFPKENRSIASNVMRLNDHKEIIQKLSKVKWTKTKYKNISILLKNLV